MTIDQFAKKYNFSYSTVVNALNQSDVKSIGKIDNGRSHKKDFDEGDIVIAMLKYFDLHKNLALKKADMWSQKATAVIRISNSPLPNEMEKMTNKREKAIKGLGCISGEYDMESNKCAGCGYENCQTFSICIAEIARDALELLKELEPVKWVKISPAGIYECSGCGQNVMTSDISAYKYCHGCGRAVKWNG